MKPDKEQTEAANYLKGHSLIIAGAGSGKTTTLLFKIDNLISKGVKENEILVISFTNETVNNFISKCKYNIDVMTFHKLANKIINSKKDIVGQEILEECTKKYLSSLPEKFQKKLFIMFGNLIFTNKKYIKDVNRFTSDNVSNIIYQTINQIKANNISINDIDINEFNNRERILIYCIKNIIDYYEITLRNNNLIDFDGLIIEATNYIKNSSYKSKYKYILVDEYQDISTIRLDFLKALIENNNAILTAVGDDFQSIYAFNGSNIELFYNFQKHFINSKIFYLKTTYRCPQNIIKKAGRFVMKNPYQIKKELISTSKVRGKIIKIKTSYYRRDLCKIINKYKNTMYTVLILSRNSFDINFYIKKNNNVKDSYIVYKNKTYKNIRFLTIHKSKGLEADIVVILNLARSYNGFPRSPGNELTNKIIKNVESYKYAEERRLFYVALTRSKIKTYLIIDRKSPSDFAIEI